MTARARRKDPATSLEAAKAVEKSGEGQRQRDLCLRAVTLQGGHTAAEIAQKTGLDRYAASRRLPELRKDGLIESRSPRVCYVTGNKSLTWYLAEKQDPQAKLFTQS